MMPPCCQRPGCVAFSAWEEFDSNKSTQQKRSYHRNKPSMSVMFFPIFSVCFFVKKHKCLLIYEKKVRSCCFQQQFWNDCKIFFIGAKNTDDPRDLTLNNFTLCELVTDDPWPKGMPFGKRRYVPRGSHPLKISPKKGWPQFSGLMCMFFFFLRFFYEGKDNSIESQVSEENKTLTKFSSEVSVKSGDFLRFFFHLFQGRFFPQWTRWESRSFTLFCCCFFCDSRLLKQSQRRQEFGGFC